MNPLKTAHCSGKAIPTDYACTCWLLGKNYRSPVNKTEHFKNTGKHTFTGLGLTRDSSDVRELTMT